jgi:hypothetical protein
MNEGKRIFSTNRLLDQAGFAFSLFAIRGYLLSTSEAQFWMNQNEPNIFAFCLTRFNQSTKLNDEKTIKIRKISLIYKDSDAQRG